MLLPEASARRVMRRCPACSARVELDALECPICGHEFGTTQPSAPLQPPPAARRRSGTPLLDGTPGDETNTGAEFATEVPLLESASYIGRSTWMTRVARNLPWGVIGVVGMVAALIGGAGYLLRDGSLLDPLRPTAAPSSNAAALVTPAVVRAATSTLPPPTITPVPVPPTRTPLPPLGYVVKPNDTCAGIAEAARISTRDLILLNGLDSDCFIVAGNKIKLPPPSPTPGPSPTPDSRAPIATSTRPPQLTYEVKDGDVCGLIAEKFGIAVKQIIAQNKLDEDCTIRVGQLLLLNFAQAAAGAGIGPTATPIVVTSPTPRAGYSAPLIIAPVDQGLYTATQAVLTLQWLTVGLLKENEWYVVQVQPDGTALVPIFETKATSLKLTSAILGGQQDRKFTWWVQVKRLISTSADGNNRVYETLSPPSAPRVFQWALK